MSGALASRGGRHALAAMVGGLDDTELERRFADPRRQRRLVKALARGFQPSQRADWVRVIAGIEDALTVMVAGRCSVEGDVVLAMRLEGIFGGRF